MFFARAFAARLLLALWLPALLHCRLEAAGLLSESACCENADAAKPAAPAESCADDACEIAEGAFAPRLTGDVSAPSPLLSVGVEDFFAPGFPPSLRPPRAVGFLEAAAAPPELRRTRVFRERAALAPRAP